MKNIRTTTQSAGGTSFHYFVVNATFNKLVKVLGQPHNYNGDKVQYEWEFETLDGERFTIYDYKEKKINKSRKYFWHIGTATKEISEKVAKILQDNGLVAGCIKLSMTVGDETIGITL